MSRIQMFVFVEGTIADAFVFGGVCAAATERVPVLYELCTARELPGDTGGKSRLLTFFSYLRRRNALLARFQGKATAVVIYLDKDVDDVKRSLRRSEHLVYTQWYDVQNYIYREGNILKGAAAAASLDPKILQAELADSKRWCRAAAEKWREWVMLCVLCAKHRIHCRTNYGVSSQINNPFGAATDRAALKEWTTRARRAAGLSKRAFADVLSKSERYVARRFQAGQHDRLFKGKWYGVILEADIKRMAGTKGYNSNGLVARLPDVVSATLDFRDSWAKELGRPVEVVAKKLHKLQRKQIPRVRRVASAIH